MKSENSAEAEEEKCHRKKKRTRETLKNLCIKNKALDLEKLGKEKRRVDKGAAIKVRNKDPIKRAGSFDKPREIAPSSRNGNTTKYALKMKKKQEEE